MIKSTTLVFLATLFSASLAATLPSSEADSSHANPPVRSRVRKAAAAGIPPEERKLQQDAVCYQAGVPPTVVPCSAGACTPGNQCYTDQPSCLADADMNCNSEGYFTIISNPNVPECAFVYSCCPGP